MSKFRIFVSECVGKSARFDKGSELGEASPC